MNQNWEEKKKQKEQVDYRNLSEEGLVALAKGDDEIALGIIFENYKPFVKAKSQMYYLLDGDKEDLIQEGMIGLFHAIRDYREEEGGFRSFAQLCITRQIYTAITKAGRKKNEPLNSSLSIDGQESEESAASQMISTQGQPEEEVIFKESVELLFETLKLELSPFEYAVFQGIQEGKNYKEIADALGKESKAVDNALQRIRRKIRGFR